MTLLTSRPSLFAPQLRKLVPALALVACAVGLHPGCSSTPPGGEPDAGAPDSGSPDSGAADSGPKACKLDPDCGANRWCEKSTGECRDAKACPQGQGNCDYQGSTTPDYCGGQACYCDPKDSACKPLHLSCTACATSPECGNDLHARDFAADCAPAGAFATGQVCIPRADSYSKCPQGYLLPTDGGVFCTPAGGRCGAVGGCSTDQECDPHSDTPICDTGRKVCVAACTFDLKTGDSSCATGQVCHLIPGLKDLPPQDPNYARGRCGAPCNNATACGTGLVCRSEGLDHPVQRCGLPPPKCLGDVECPESPSTNSHGYCELVTHDCQTDCRAKDDCRAGYACTGAAGSRKCVAETCLQAGGAATGCDYGQFCCGEQSAPSCPSPVQGGACFAAPLTTWCGTCQNSDDCRKSPYPIRPGQVNLCVGVGNNKNACALGCDPGKAAECPRGWGCTEVQVGCQKDSDCGSQSGAHCDDPDGGSNGTCTCSSDANCPNKAHQASEDTLCDSKGKCFISNVCRPYCP